MLAAGGFLRAAAGAPLPEAGVSSATTGSGSIVVVEAEPIPASAESQLSRAVAIRTGIVRG